MNEGSAMLAILAVVCLPIGIILLLTYCCCRSKEPPMGYDMPPPMIRQPGMAMSTPPPMYPPMPMTPPVMMPMTAPPMIKPPAFNNNQLYNTPTPYG